jgi:hypothetical protein
MFSTNKERWSDFVYYPRYDSPRACFVVCSVVKSESDEYFEQLDRTKNFLDSYIKQGPFQLYTSFCEGAVLMRWTQRSEAYQLMARLIESDVALKCHTRVPLVIDTKYHRVNSWSSTDVNQDEFELSARDHISIVNVYF